MSVRRALALVALVAAPAEARELLGDWLELTTALKSDALLSRAPDDSALYPEADGAATFWRLRLEPQARLEPVTIDVAYEQRLRTRSGSAAGGLGVLPPDTAAPYRVVALGGTLASATGYVWEHEIDRALLAAHLGAVELTVGRQAIGWGRGVLFGAVDLFAPFSPLEADREWRRGVDALRADVKLASRISLDAVAGFGERLDDSAFAARLRGFAGDVDLELVGGWRAGDVVAGVTTSAAVGDAEVHGELALFDGDDGLVTKALAGASYRFALGTGLLAVAEYHYSGFGAARPEDIARQLGDPGFQKRLARGDTQILGRHALALVLSYEVAPELALSAVWLQSPVDGSGVAAPSATVTLGDRLSLVLGLYVPYGARPDGPELHSEYGAAPVTGLMQLRVYD